MHTPIIRCTAFPGSARLLGGIALFAFLGVFFVMPLWAAFSICTMPCCHHDAPAAMLMSSDAMACGSNECSVRADDVRPTTVASAVPETRASLTVPTVEAAEVITTPVVAARSASFALCPQRGADAPVHVLNSTFRI